MAELTNLETKLGEVIGLVMAGQAVTQKVITLEKNHLKAALEGSFALAQEDPHSAE